MYSYLLSNDICEAIQLLENSAIDVIKIEITRVITDYDVYTPCPHFVTGFKDIWIYKNFEKGV